MPPTYANTALKEVVAVQAMLVRPFGHFLTDFTLHLFHWCGGVAQV